MGLLLRCSSYQLQKQGGQCQIEVFTRGIARYSFGMVSASSLTAVLAASVRVVVLRGCVGHCMCHISSSRCSVVSLVSVSTCSQVVGVRVVMPIVCIVCLPIWRRVGRPRRGLAHLLASSAARVGRVGFHGDGIQRTQHRVGLLFLCATSGALQLSRDDIVFVCGIASVLYKRREVMEEVRLLTLAIYFLFPCCSPASV